MQNKNIVSIVGRPNVGKSSLLNRFIKKRIAVVESIPGVTRDRHYQECEWNGKKITLVDTGGITIHSPQGMNIYINEQIRLAIDESRLLLMVVDGTTGITQEDQAIARELKRQKVPVILLVNKVDAPELKHLITPFYRLGLGEPQAISAIHGQNVADILDLIMASLPDEPLTDTEPFALRIAIVGRPNSGKSTLTNMLLHQNRMIVSSELGTTRDAVDTPLEYQGKKYILIDTAGLRQKAKVKESVEYFCNLRAINSIHRADVVVLLLDGSLHLDNQDLKILSLVREEKKGMVVVINKWDLTDKDGRTYDQMVTSLQEREPLMKYIPTVAVSALVGTRAFKVLDLADQVWKNMNHMVDNQDLDEYFRLLFEKHPHPVVSNSRVKLFHLSQTSTRPPLFAVYTNHPDLVRESYKRFLYNQVCERYDFSGCPVQIYYRGKAAYQSAQCLEEERTEVS